MKKLILLFWIMVGSLAVAVAQQNDEGGQDLFSDIQPAEDNNKDSSTSSNTDGSVKKPEPKPFVRMVLPVDTITNLVTYTEVVEQEESQADSLYERAKKWAVKNFTKFGEKSKEIFEIDKKGAKIVVNGYIDAYMYSGKYSKKNFGYHNFKMTILIKEGRYKYIISNLVNTNKLFPGDKGEPVKTYFEYYNTTTVNPKGADAVLRGADADIRKLIDSFKREMKDRPTVDEDEW